MTTPSLTPSLPHHILSHPLVEGVVGVCHSVTVEILQTVLTKHPELDTTIIKMGGRSYTIIRTGGRSYTLGSLKFATVCLLHLLPSLSPDEPHHVVVGAHVEFVCVCVCVCACVCVCMCVRVQSCTHLSMCMWASASYYTHSN